MATALPPGPRFRWPLTALQRMRRDPLRFFEELAAYGPIAYFRIGTQPVYLVSDPSLIEDILVGGAGHFRKGQALERSKRVLGEGLLTNEGAAHLRQRRLVQPAFHKARIAAYAEAMIHAAVGVRDAWREGVPLDVSREMNRLALTIVADTLFGAAVGSDADTQRVQQAITDVVEMFDLVMVPFAEWLMRLPLPRVRRYDAARRALDAVVYRIIAERRASPEDRGDLLSMLLHADDPEGGGTMSDRQLRDEVITLFLAGHETTGNALTWTWVLLARHPHAEQQLHAELDSVLGGRAPTADDLPRLSYTRAVIAESMRLYPPAWTMGRRPLRPYRCGDYEVPVDALILMSQWIVHRDPRYWPEPERFDPSRWAGEAKGRPRFAYFPFGGGTRICVGESFAWTEAMLALATIAQRWRLVLDPAHPVEPQPLITLRARYGVRAMPELRRRTADAHRVEDGGRRVV